MSVGSDAPTGLESVPLSPTEFSSTVTAIARAFGNPTRREIFLFAHEREDGVTASEVAQNFELHANVARHHLDKLAAGGHLEVSSERRHSAGAGRPSKRYVVPHADEARGLVLDVAVRHDDLIITLLGRALELLPADAAEQMAEEVGMEYGRTLVTALGSDGEYSFRAALHAVAEALTAHGFAAHAERQGDELRIVAQHCPFGSAAIDHPVICAVDRGLVKGMLALLYGETSLETSASLPMGDDVCVTAIED